MGELEIRSYKLPLQSLYLPDGLSHHAALSKTIYIDPSKVLFNFLHGPLRENPSTSLEKNALKLIKLPFIKVIHPK